MREAAPDQTGVPNVCDLVPGVEIIMMDTVITRRIGSPSDHVAPLSSVGNMIRAYCDGRFGPPINTQ